MPRPAVGTPLVYVQPHGSVKTPAERDPSGDQLSGNEDCGEQRRCSRWRRDPCWKDVKGRCASQGYKSPYAPTNEAGASPLSPPPLRLEGNETCWGRCTGTLGLRDYGVSPCQLRGHVIPPWLSIAPACPPSAAREDDRRTRLPPTLSRNSALF